MNKQHTIIAIYPKVLFLLCLTLCTYKISFSQELIPLELSVGKTVHLFFNSNVKYCDIGNSDIEQKVNGNIVKIFTNKVDFTETNLTIITTDNLCYNLLLIYSAVPRALSITLDPKFAKLVKADVAATPQPTSPPIKVVAPPVQKTPDVVKTVLPKKVIVVKKISRDSLILLTCKKLLVNKPRYPDVAHISKQMAFMISNIVSDDSCLYVSVYVQNHSYFDYLVSFVNFQTVEKKNLFASKNREEVKKPIFIYNKNETFASKKIEKMVYVFNKFKIAKKRKLYVEIAERNDQRFLAVVIPASYINKAKRTE